MSITNGYCTLDDVRQALGFDEDEGHEWNTRLGQEIQAVSRWIDDETPYRFYTTVETRYYTPVNAYKVYVDAFHTATTPVIKTDPDGDLDYDYTWAATDYLLMPRNASTDGRPYTWIQRHPNGDYYFPVGTQTRRGLISSVEITASFGFCATGSQPDEITEACVLAVEQLFQRKDAIYGVTGPMGLSYSARVMLKSDPHIMGLIGHFRSPI